MEQASCAVPANGEQAYRASSTRRMSISINMRATSAVAASLQPAAHSMGQHSKAHAEALQAQQKA
jgi:hypothetical protein